MRYRTLGRTGIKVSAYALGAMMFGAAGNHDESIRIIRKALDAGINVIDTADIYSNGESEEIVGKALKDRRDSVVPATKARGRPRGEPGHGHRGNAVGAVGPDPQGQGPRDRDAPVNTASHASRLGARTLRRVHDLHRAIARARGTIAGDPAGGGIG
jgi:aryl-alcohol dehydrogenase-like predicted oxidoreductase